MIVVADRDVVPGRRAPRERRQPSRESLEQGGLASAVLAEDRQAFAAEKLEGDAGNDRNLESVSDRQVPRPQETAPPDARGLETKSDRCHVLGRLFQNLHARELGPPPLRLAGVDAGDVAPDVFLLLVDELLLLLERA